MSTKQYDVLITDTIQLSMMLPGSQDDAHVAVSTTTRACTRQTTTTHGQRLG